MLAVDTNFIVRYVTRDDPRQAARARRIVDENDTFVTTTVLLETEWVLRRGYGYSRAAILGALRSFSGLPRVSLEAPARAFEALEGLENGMDFADALHLAGAGECEAFVSFDRSLVRTAARVSKLRLRVP